MTSPLRDAAESATAGVPVVRGLEWRQLTSPREDGPSDLIAGWESDCVVGTYIIKDDGAEWWLHLADLFDVQQVGRSSDPDLLRNVAQADYEQRILSALNPDFLSELDTARAEIERLRGRLRDAADERDNLSTIVATEIDDVAGAELDDLEERAITAESALTAAQARIAELEAALKPFGEAGDIFEARAEAPPQSDEDPVHSWTHHKVGTRTITVGDFRHARATLSPVKENDRG